MIRSVSDKFRTLHILTTSPTLLPWFLLPWPLLLSPAAELIRPTLTPTGPFMSQVLNLADHLAEALLDVIHPRQHQLAQHVLVVRAVTPLHPVRDLRRPAGRHLPKESVYDRPVVAEV